MNIREALLLADKMEGTAFREAWPKPGSNHPHYDQPCEIRIEPICRVALQFRRTAKRARWSFGWIPNADDAAGTDWRVRLPSGREVDRA